MTPEEEARYEASLAESRAREMAKEPYMACGECGGMVKMFQGVRYGRPIVDWKHASAPPGTAPHRPVLGTPVDTETLDRIHRPVREEGPVAHIPPITFETVRCRQDDLPMAAAKLLLLAQDYGWQVLGATRTRISTGGRLIGLAMVRHDVGFVAFWRMRNDETSWKFDEAYTLASTGIRERVGSNVLKDWIKIPQRICPVCDRSDVVTNHEECAP